MDWLPVFIALLLGFAMGLLAAYVLRLVQAKTATELAEQLFRESEAQRKESMDAVIEHMESSFGKLSLDALSQSTDQLLKLAKERIGSEREISSQELNAKKGLIDQQLVRMTAELDDVSKLMAGLEKDRVEKFGELASQLKSTNEQTASLMDTTRSLREALASTQARGQWGERMAEDVLRLAGFIEDVNYLKQKSVENSQSRPDFTFLLPRDLKVHMDVKFPLDNYLKYLQCESSVDKERCRRDFLRDVRSRIKEVTTRDYINPEQDTVDYVLLFIPNEQVYAFIHEQDRAILDESLQQKVVFCSPVTLFAILAVIRQAVDNFALERTSDEILSLLGAFKKQWGMFMDRFDRLGTRLSSAQREYDSLITTRRRQLERPLDKIESFRTQRNLPVASDEEAEIPPLLEGDGEISE